MYWRVEVQPVVAAAVPVTAPTACIHSQHNEHAQHTCVQQQLALCSVVACVRVGHAVVCGVGTAQEAHHGHHHVVLVRVAAAAILPCPPPSLGHGAASCSAWCACPPSAPARGKAPQLLSRPASNAPLKCTRVAAAPQEAQHSSTHSSLCDCVQPQVCPRSAREDRPEVTRPCASRACSTSQHLQVCQLQVQQGRSGAWGGSALCAG
jgi:hypothetical protein